MRIVKYHHKIYKLNIHDKKRLIENMLNGKINVIMSGLPGKMATKVAEKVLEQEDIKLNDFALTGDIKESKMPLNGRYINLLKPSEHEYYLRTLVDKKEEIVIVDYTQPDSVHKNAGVYSQQEIPFIMGTTGGDGKMLESIVRNSMISAVISPNMAKPIVAFQEFMRDYSARKKGSLEGSYLDITESHQSTKKDTSGTAKVMINYFDVLGIPFEKKQIVMLRDEKDYIRIEIPEKYFDAHGWHMYRINSKDSRRPKNLNNLSESFYDFLSMSPVFKGYKEKYNQREGIKDLWRISDDEEGTVRIGMKYDSVLNSLKMFHIVYGRDVYASGTLDAIRFLNNRVYKDNQRGKVYSMTNVINDGNGKR